MRIDMDIQTTKELRIVGFLDRSLKSEGGRGPARVYYARSHHRMRDMLTAGMLAIVCIGLLVFGTMWAQVALHPFSAALHTLMAA